MTYDFQITAEYHTGEAIFDAQQLVEAADALAAVNLFLHSVRQQIGAAEVVTIVRITATIQVPPDLAQRESVGDSPQPRTQPGERAPGA